MQRRIISLIPQPAVAEGFGSNLISMAVDSIRMAAEGLPLTIGYYAEAVSDLLEVSGREPIPPMTEENVGYELDVAKTIGDVCEFKFIKLSNSPVCLIVVVEDIETVPSLITMCDLYSGDGSQIIFWNASQDEEVAQALDGIVTVFRLLNEAGHVASTSNPAELREIVTSWALWAGLVAA